MSRLKRTSQNALAIGGLMLASLPATAQNWVSSGTPGRPVIPFDAIVDGYTSPSSPGGPKTPLYTCRGGINEGFNTQLGMFIPGTTGCTFGYGGLEYTVPDFEFLVTSWQAETGGTIPPNAVVGGYDTPAPGQLYGPTLYYCRGKIGERAPRPSVSLQLGKIRADFGGCLVPYSGTEVLLIDYEVLVGLSPAMPVANVAASNGFVPQDAIRAGTDVDGTPLYLCSAVFANGRHPGKLHSSFGGCNISYGGVEHTISEYLVLRPDWLGIPNFDFPAGTDTGGAALYVCRGFFSGGLYPGKTRKGWATCNFGLDGKEQTATYYEILSH